MISYWYYDEIKNNLEFLKNYQGFIKYTLTGPTITINSGIEYVDIDVVVWFDSLENYLNQQVKIHKNCLCQNDLKNIKTGQLQSRISIQ